MTVTSVRTTQLGKRFQNRDVLVDVALSVTEGECVAILGDNASGKTTLLRCLSGSIRPSRGEIRWFDQVRFTPEVRSLIGSLADEPRVYSHLTVRENLVFAARMYDLCDAKQQADRWIEWCGLTRFRHEPLSTLSRGIHQRVAIARTFMHDPKLVLLDEPFTSLDHAGCEMLVTLVREALSGDRVVIFTTHQAEFISELASRVVRLEYGTLRHAGSQVEHDHERPAVAA